MPLYHVFSTTIVDASHTYHVIIYTITVHLANKVSMALKLIKNTLISNQHNIRKRHIQLYKYHRRKSDLLKEKNT